MDLYFSKEHKRHDPSFEIFENGQHINYYESPKRIEEVLGELKKQSWAALLPALSFDPSEILRVHTSEYFTFLQTIFARWVDVSPDESKKFNALYPSAHPTNFSNKIPENINGALGYFVKDLSAPILEGTFAASLSSANCALSAAANVKDGAMVSVALCRPPGHHSGKRSCAGYCYFNNAAIAAASLAQNAKVAILDIDYHAGNGTQEIFYESNQVLTISIHADPHQEYPYYAGFANEIGAGAGFGFHRNIPLPQGTEPKEYLNALSSALFFIKEFKPAYLVLSAGFDTYKEDPLGSFKLDTFTYNEIGKRIQGLNTKTVVILEGGYYLPALGKNLVSLLEPLSKI
jgi:acetoin utilization deacetylase AcuC-like enzyme